jgi:alpha-L-fucosidase
MLKEVSQRMSYKPTLESIRSHQVPDWFHHAKLGIFIHWGLYSVPAWAPLAGGFDLGQAIEQGEWAKWFAHNPYAEWYLNSIRIKGSSSYQYHLESYGQHFSYFDFVPIFKEQSQKADFSLWADLFKRVGARYVVLTTKHHDGFLLWPSTRQNPFHPGYFSERDLVGELAEAVRERGLKMGLYYSGGLDWTFNDTVIQDIADIAKAIPQQADYVNYATQHWRELIERYEPSILWNDIGYPAAIDLNPFFADYYNKIPEGVINNRFNQKFGGEDPDSHFDFKTPEYTTFSQITGQKWEATRGIGYSFGYNRNEGVESYLSVEALVHSFVDIVSKNGNLLLNIGPAADGVIPELQRERLEGLGRWLEVNGEAIFDTRPWLIAEGSADSHIPVRFTQKQASLYAILLGQPAGPQVKLAGLVADPNTSVQLLGDLTQLPWHQTEQGIVIAWPDHLSHAPAYSFKITPSPLMKTSL